MLDRPLFALTLALFAASAVVALVLVGGAPLVGAAAPSILASASALPDRTPPNVSAPSPASSRVGPLTMTLRPEHSVLAPEEVSATTMVEVQADEQADDLVARPVALTIVVDVSGSMSGAKIIDARAGAARLVERLGDDDLLSIVGFESASRTVLEPVRLGNGRSQAASAVEQLQPLGGTCMSCGLDAAYALLAEAPDTHDRRIVIFSDGHANEGISTPDGLAAIVSAAREGHAIVSTTVGLGGDYDAPLLNLLAQRGMGSHLFSPGPGAIARILDREVARIRGVVARNVTIELTPAPGVRIGQIDGEMTRDGDGRVTIALGPMSASDRRRFLVPLSLGAGPLSSVVTARLLTATDRSNDTPLRLTRSADPKVVRASIDFEAAGYLAARAASSARTEAVAIAAAGDREGAQAMLQLALTDLGEAHALTGLAELKVEMEEVEKNLEGILNWTEPELKSMLNNTQACDLEVRRGVRAEGRWNVVDLLEEHASY